MVSGRLQDGGNQKLQKCHSWPQMKVSDPGLSPPPRIPRGFRQWLCLLTLSPPFIQRFTPQLRNRWCPLSRVDVGTRWCTAPGLAQHAKLNFNVSEQLNDRGLIRTHGLFTGLKTSKPKRHKQCSTATVAARLANCMFARSHSA